MKSRKFLLLSMLSLGLLLTAAHKADAQRFYVSVQPAVPYYAHPACPSPRHVWVESEWVWSGGAYVHHPGYWAIPPHRYHTWVAGYWVREPRGSYWVGGHWRR